MTRRRALLLALAGLALLVGLAVGWLALRRPTPPALPPRGASAVAPEVPRSTLVVPIAISLEGLEASMNQSVPTVFVEERERALEHGLVLDAKVSRAGPLSLAVVDGVLRTVVPVDTRVEVRTQRAKRPAVVDCGLSLTARTRLELGEDWRLRSKTALDYAWTRPPTLTVGRLEVPIQGLLDAQLPAQLARAAEQVDQNLRERDPVRARVEQIWAQVHAPLPLGGATPAWLGIAPERLLAGPLQLRRDGIHLEAGLSGRFRLVVGEAPAPAPDSPLPARAAPAEGEALALQVPVTLSWEAASEALTRAIAGRSERIAVPGSDEPLSLRLERATLYPSGEAVVLVLGYGLDGPSTPLDGRGELVLSGVPRLDAEAQVLRFAELGAAVATDRAAVDAVAWLVGTGALEELERRATVSLAEPIAAAKRRVAEALEASKERPAALSGALTDLRLSRVVPTDEGLVLEILARGRVEVAISALPPREGPPRAKPKKLDLGGVLKGGGKRWDER